jgi:hypothetical protein
VRPSTTLLVRHERRGEPVDESSTRGDCRCASVAAQAASAVTQPVKLWVHCLAERLAIVRAVTRVNPEQASKVVPWTPTRLTNGEGWYPLSKQPTHADDGVHRGTGSSTGERFSAQRGRSALGERSRLSTPSVGRRPTWKSERSIVLRKPGNAGGGKGPRFWVLPTMPRIWRLA